jgi:hypothetical protein
MEYPFTKGFELVQPPEQFGLGQVVVFVLQCKGCTCDVVSKGRRFSGDNPHQFADRFGSGVSVRAEQVSCKNPALGRNVGLQQFTVVTGHTQQPRSGVDRTGFAGPRLILEELDNRSVSDPGPPKEKGAQQCETNPDD